MSKNMNLNRNISRPSEKQTMNAARYLQLWHSDFILCIWATFCQATSIHNKWSASLVCMVVNLCCLVQCSREYLGFVSPNSLASLRMYLCVCLESLLESVPITARDTSIPDVMWVLLLYRNNKGTINLYLHKISLKAEEVKQQRIYKNLTIKSL